MLCATLLMAQRVTLSGTVRDAATGESLMGAYVILTDTANPNATQGCVSNQAGFYSISVMRGTYKLSVSYLSYKTIEETLVLDKTVSRSFDLEPTAIAGEEVVIQGERTDRNIASADVGRMEMKIEAIKAMPALMGEADIIKSIQLLPGVATTCAAAAPTRT